MKPPTRRQKRRATLGPTTKYEPSGRCALLSSSSWLVDSSRWPHVLYKETSEVADALAKGCCKHKNKDSPGHYFAFRKKMDSYIYIWIQDLVFPRISQQSKGEKIPALYIQKCCSVSRSPSFSKTRVCAESRCTRGKSLHRSYSPDAVHPEKVGQQPLPRVLGRSRQPFFRSRPFILPLLYIVCATLYSVHDRELDEIVQHPPAIS